jgi:hypothetical protein
MISNISCRHLSEKVRGVDMLVLCAIVVIYQQSPAESAFLRTLIRNVQDVSGEGVSVAIEVWDNTPNNDNREYIDRLSVSGINICYSTAGENVSLSNVYNGFFDKYERRVDFLLLLDQDTDLPPNYLHSFVRYVREYPGIHLFVPRVRCNSALRSPGKRFFFKGYSISGLESGVHSGKNWLIINSGMFLSANYLLKTRFRYDSRLGFYAVDTYFSIAFFKCNDFVVLDCDISHSLASDLNESYEKKLWRLNDRLSGMRIVYCRGLMSCACFSVYSGFLRAFHTARYFFKSYV